MVDRIKQIMEYVQMSPTAFADTIGINRSSLAHIFSGRNQPSLDVAKKILTSFPEISTEWLIMGVGDMLQTPLEEKAKPKEELPVSVSTVDNMQQTDLFSAMEMADAIVATESVPISSPAPSDKVSQPVMEQKIDEPVIENSSEEDNLKEDVPVNEQVKSQPVRQRAKIQESHIPVRESKRDRISNSQADKKIAKIIFFYDDKSFDVYTPN